MTAYKGQVLGKSCGTVEGVDAFVASFFRDRESRKDWEEKGAKSVSQILCQKIIFEITSNSNKKSKSLSLFPSTLTSVPTANSFRCW